jgi:hypothetical protein
MFKYEKKSKQLLPLKEFYFRLFINAIIVFFIISGSLLIGIAGYMYYAHLSFADAVLNASMILSGMGPVNELNNNAAKYFASFYALFSGITFLSTIGILFAPILHRAMHRFHLEVESE